MKNFTKSLSVSVSSDNEEEEEENTNITLEGLDNLEPNSPTIVEIEEEEEVNPPEGDQTVINKINKADIVFDDTTTLETNVEIEEEEQVNPPEGDQIILGDFGGFDGTPTLETNVEIRPGGNDHNAVNLGRIFAPGGNDHNVVNLDRTTTLETNVEIEEEEQVNPPEGDQIILGDFGGFDRTPTLETNVEIEEEEQVNPPEGDQIILGDFGGFDGFDGTTIPASKLQIILGGGNDHNVVNLDRIFAVGENMEIRLGGGNDHNPVNLDRIFTIQENMEIRLGENDHNANPAAINLNRTLALGANVELRLCTADRILTLHQLQALMGVDFISLHIEDDPHFSLNINFNNTNNTMIENQTALALNSGGKIVINGGQFSIINFQQLKNNLDLPISFNISGENPIEGDAVFVPPYRLASIKNNDLIRLFTIDGNNQLVEYIPGLPELTSYYNSLILQKLGHLIPPNSSEAVNYNIFCNIRFEEANDLRESIIQNHLLKTLSGNLQCELVNSYLTHILENIDLLRDNNCLDLLYKIIDYSDAGDVVLTNLMQTNITEFTDQEKLNFFELLDHASVVGIKEIQQQLKNIQENHILIDRDNLIVQNHINDLLDQMGGLDNLHEYYTAQIGNVIKNDFEAFDFVRNSFVDFH